MNTRSRWVAAPRMVCLFSLVFFLASGSRPDGAVSEVEPLLAGTACERQLAEGASHVYRLQLMAGRRWVVRLDQLGADVELEARWAGGGPLRVDSPLDRDGAEFLLLPPAATRDVELTVRALSAAGETGRYRIRLDAVEGVDRTDVAQVAVLEVMTQAGQAYAEGGAEGWLRALGRFREAVELWRDLRHPRLGAQCLYAAAVIHRLLGEGPAALELARQVLPLWRALGDAGREADTLNEIGLAAGSTGRVSEARESFREALAVQERAGDLYRQAATASNLCLTFLMQGEHRQGLDCYGPALERIRAAHDEETEAVALTNLGWILATLGQPDEALDHYRRAVALHHAAGREKREAETLNNLALLHQHLDEPQDALTHYLRALAIFRRHGDRRWEGRLLHNLGTIYQRLGDPERALVFYRQALASRLELGDLAGQANSLKVLGSVELGEGRAKEALELFRRALKMEQLTEDHRGAAVAESFVGQALAALGEHRGALDLFDRALGPVRAQQDRRFEALTLLQKGRSLLALEHLPEATEALVSAAALYRSLGSGRGESEALYRLAEVESAVGHSERAMARVGEAISLSESLQAGIDDPDLRATFSGSWFGAYELRIELLMALYDADGNSRHLRAALETSEQARARGLMELLRQAGAELLAGLQPELADQLRAARRRLHLQAGQRQKLLERNSSTDEVGSAEVDFFQALAELEHLEARIRRESPGDAALTPPSSLTADEIQQLLDPDTALLEIALGRDRSFLFVVTHEAVRAVELPPRQVIEGLARRIYEELSTPAPGGVQSGGDPAAELTRVLLAPALDTLTARRLVVVADGALDYLPFAALPLPASAEESGTAPVLTRYEVVHLPSASVLAVVRKRRKGRPPAPRWAAVLADPVFDRRDLRLEPAANSAEGPVAARQPQDLELSRLRMSRREAENIAALAPPGEVLVALDFDANRSLALDGGLADYRIVHFATHGVVDARYPALSGLALSLFDRDGNPRDGFLRLRDVYGMRLRADLVVLSACRTALGKEVRGEGLMGLTRGFLHAGASRVVASLWSVPDHATTELMARFYHAMRRDALPPAAALRQAQLSMAGERRWSDPNGWAGFVLLGDWR